MLLARSQRDRAARIARWCPDTALAARARLAVRDGEADRVDRVAAPIASRCPTDARPPCRTGRLLAIPVHPKAVHIEAGLLACLPARVATHRSEQLDPVGRLTGEQQLGVDVIAVD